MRIGARIMTAGIVLGASWLAADLPAAGALPLPIDPQTPTAVRSPLPAVTVPRVPVPPVAVPRVAVPPVTVTPSELPSVGELVAHPLSVLRILSAPDDVTPPPSVPVAPPPTEPAAPPSPAVDRPTPALSMGSSVGRRAAPDGARTTRRSAPTRAARSEVPVVIGEAAATMDDRRAGPAGAVQSYVWVSVVAWVTLLFLAVQRYVRGRRGHRPASVGAGPVMVAGPVGDGSVLAG